jgi:biopolymer transport protein ExbB
MDSIIGFDLIIRGGPIMIALLICSAVSLAIIIERLIFLRYGRIVRLEMLMEIEIAIKKNDFALALDWSKKANSPMLKIAEVALINADKSKDDLRSAIEEAGRMEAAVLEKFLTILQTIAVISPLLGLLGTVTGMIDVFKTIVTEGTGNAAVLAGGISEALLTTAGGLSIAIPTIVFYNLFNKKVENLIVEMEHHSIILHELLSTEYAASTAEE